MKKTRIKILSVIIAIICLVPMLSLSSFAAGENYSQIVIVAGQDVTDGGYWKIKSNGKIENGTESNYNFAYNSVSNTLTLKNAEFENAKIGTVRNLNFNMATGIVSVKDLNIELVGENVITIKNAKNMEATGVYNVFGSTFFSGEGSLSINAETSGAMCCGIAAGTGEIRISDTSVSFSASDCSSQGTVGMIGNKILIDNSDIDFNFEDSDNSYGIFSNPQGCLLQVENSDLDMVFNNCKNSVAIEIFSVTFSGSDVDITLDNKDTGASAVNHGIFTYTLLIENSNVDVDIFSESQFKNNRAVSYYTCMINTTFVDRSNVELGDYLTSVSITPERIETSVKSVKAGTASVFNFSQEANYYICKEGKISGTTNKNGNWNIYFDRNANTLYLRNAELSEYLSVEGYGKISLEGENKIVCADASSAIMCSSAPEFTGNGKLTVYATDAAIKCSDGIVLGENVTAKASLSSDGADAEDYDNAKSGQYKWIEITAENEEEQKELTFFQKIAEFFKNIFKAIGDFFRNLFQ
ncbi:MAG: hypothetical protein IJF20_06800 [Clostridia bacterium]|nr:hypothetical protein [Clostridia bacterium]